jgi:pimeloyl-ACP methyl ester carboxylesterase
LAAGLMLAAPWAAKAQTVPLQVQRLDDTLIQAYVDAPPKTGKAPILLQFQGSGCVALGPGGRGLLPLSAPGMVRLSIEKYGLDPQTAPQGAPCPKTYLDHNDIDGRVFDALTVLAKLRADAPWWDGRLFVSGVSEGATVAALVGGFAAETRGVVLINGAVGEPFREGWTKAMVASASPDKADAVRAEAERAWQKARTNPTSAETAFGATNTYRWWSAIIDVRAANLLLVSKVPVLALQSQRDQMTPASSFEAMVARFKAAGRADVTFEILPGLDHGFRDEAGAVRAEIPIKRASQWLRDRTP